ISLHTANNETPFRMLFRRSGYNVNTNEENEVDGPIDKTENGEKEKFEEHIKLQKPKNTENRSLTGTKQELEITKNPPETKVDERREKYYKRIARNSSVHTPKHQITAGSKV